MTLWKRAPLLLGAASTALLAMWGDIFDAVPYLLCGVLMRAWLSRQESAVPRWGWLLLYLSLFAVAFDMLNRVEGYPNGEHLWAVLFNGVFVLLGAGAIGGMIQGQRRLGALALALLLLPVLQAPAMGARQLVATLLDESDETGVALRYVTRITPDRVYGVGVRSTCRVPADCLVGVAYRRSGRTLSLEAQGALGRFTGSMDDQWPNLHPLLWPLVLPAPE